MKLFSHTIRLYCRLAGLSLLSCLFSIEAVAGCSRPINAPILPSGLTVIVKPNGYAGILPDFLTQVAEKSGCKFVFQLVPKSRQEALFESGQSDMLLTAVRTSRRDQFGIFIPLVQLRASLISIENGQIPTTSTTELVARPTLKLLVVRGFDYGAAYQRIVDDMQQQGRLVVEGDAVSVARMMRSNPNYVTIMAPTIFSGMVQTESKLADIVGKIRYEKLDDFPWSESGIYLSSKALNEADRNLLKTTMEKIATSDAIWKAYQQYYSPEVVKLGLRPRDSH
ncbi:hypothetical protein RF679_03535 [Undibacterium cyanobacteriorum]|uniref:Solute-binding protein family 3/N-terminal domain-containing protein n=1 Tax=Undibacterium cyanobacteriorum TaxID=3073561 RepID=A0ABY9RJI8_9BURK|nr:hypothetical protein [Undibacterium sp. 20NA77.5]WMW81362.1 hypothetical protein RF679_03535 [Undibacterium sp. 20NA77.5]